MSQAASLLPQTIVLSPPIFVKPDVDARLPRSGLISTAIILIGAILAVVVISRLLEMSQRVFDLESRPTLLEEQIKAVVKSQIDNTVKEMETAARKHHALRIEQIQKAQEIQRAAEAEIVSQREKFVEVAPSEVAVASRVPVDFVTNATEELVHTYKALNGNVELTERTEPAVVAVLQSNVVEQGHEEIFDDEALDVTTTTQPPPEKVVSTKKRKAVVIKSEKRKLVL